MTYYTHTEGELKELGVREGELVIYTGTVNPRQSDSLSPRADSKNAYVYIWQDGQTRELDARFLNDSAGLDVLEAQTGEEEYTFLRDKPSGYIRQISGPAKPVTVANIGAIPLRVDSFLGKFTVHAGTMLRMDENAPRREKRKVLLTVSSRYDHPLQSAELWDGISWRRLNIREEPFVPGDGCRFAVLNSKAIVQYMEVNEKREILMMDSPEPDPDYEIYICAAASDWVTLRFNQTDYRDGQVVQRSRIPYGGWGESVIYDLQKLRESLTQNAVRQCIVELPGLQNQREPGPTLERRTRRPDSEKLRKFLDGDEERETPILPSANMEDSQEEVGEEEDTSCLAELLRFQEEIQEFPVPEPPENFPA